MSSVNTTAAHQFQKLYEQASQQVADLKEKTSVLVGTATCGKAAGALEVLEAFRTSIEKQQLDVQVIEVGCMGHCYAEPMIIINKPGFPSLCYGSVDEGKAGRLAVDYLANDDPCFEFAMAALEPNDMFPTFEDYPRGVYEQKMVLADCGLIDPEDINQYIAGDGYKALAKALQAAPAQVVSDIKEAKLRGRGGAGFPTGIKWEICHQAPGTDKYVICNADEGDPGAFMDRALLESNPHQVIEGLIIAGYAVGATKGFFYVRAEYPCHHPSSYCLDSSPGKRYPRRFRSRFRFFF